jgi:hypothetical protein
LHDGAQQGLVSLAATLRMAREKLDSEPRDAGRRVWEVSYSRCPWPANRRPPLAVIDDHERDATDYFGTVIA